MIGRIRKDLRFGVEDCECLPAGTISSQTTPFGSLQGYRAFEPLDPSLGEVARARGRVWPRWRWRSSLRSWDQAW